MILSRIIRKNSGYDKKAEFKYNLKPVQKIVVFFLNKNKFLKSTKSFIKIRKRDSLI